MSARSKSLVKLFQLLPVLCLFHAVFAEATSQAYPLQIKVLSAEYHALDSGTPVPKNCDLQNFDAYCNESKNPTVQNVMVVQDADGKFFTIGCTVDSRWSKCAPLPVGQTFDARKDKHGITVLYLNAKGKETKRLYQLIVAAPAPQSGVTAQTQPAPPARISTVPAAAPAPAPAPPASAHQVAPESAHPENREKVRCNFSSTPPSAEITLDGKYVGNTPSEISVSTGTHVVVFSMPGFGEWKRDLTVVAGSVVNVTANLQKTQ